MSDPEPVLDPPMRLVSEEEYQCGLAEDRMLADPRELTHPYRLDFDDQWPPWSKPGTAHQRPSPGQP